MLRRLLAIAPVALLVACGVPAAQRGYAEAPVPERAATRTAAASPTPAVDVVPVEAAAPGPTRPTDDPPPVIAARDGCNRNYTPCVPNDPVDVDCEGGSGNGPSYVIGPVQVVGSDVYGLDADHNGVGCEAGAAVTSAGIPVPAAPQMPLRPTSEPAPQATARPTPPPRTTEAAPPPKPTSRPTSASTSSDSGSPSVASD